MDLLFFPNFFIDFDLLSPLDLDRDLEAYFLFAVFSSLGSKGTLLGCLSSSLL